MTHIGTHVGALESLFTNEHNLGVLRRTIREAHLHVYVKGAPHGGNVICYCKRCGGIVEAAAVSDGTLTATAPGLKAALEFISPARQPVRQDLPIVNNSDSDWSVQASLKAEDFSGPPNFKVPAKQTAHYLDNRPKVLQDLAPSCGSEDDAKQLMNAILYGKAAPRGLPELVRAFAEEQSRLRDADVAKHDKEFKKLLAGGFMEADAKVRLQFRLNEREERAVLDHIVRLATRNGCQVCSFEHDGATALGPCETLVAELERPTP